MNPFVKTKKHPRKTGSAKNLLYERTQGCLSCADRANSITSNFLQKSVFHKAVHLPFCYGFSLSLCRGKVNSGGCFRLPLFPKEVSMTPFRCAAHEGIIIRYLFFGVLHSFRQLRY